MLLANIDWNMGGDSLEGETSLVWACKMISPKDIERLDLQNVNLYKDYREVDFDGF